MKYLVLMIMIISTSSYAVDKQRHRDMSTYLNSLVLALESTNPNKALVYLSERDDVDQIDTAIVMIDSADVSDGQVRIIRPTSTMNGVVSPSTAITKCQADFGEVDILANELIVYTDRLPVRVRCESADGSYIQSYKTLFSN